MARMGMFFEECGARYSEFPVRQASLSWEEYLPPLSRPLRELAETTVSARRLAQRR